MTELTERQKANRQYHLKHKARIREKKRQQYAEKVARQGQGFKAPKKTTRGVDPVVKNTELPSARRRKVKEKDRLAKRLRWDLEDIEFLRRCGVVTE